VGFCLNEAVHAYRNCGRYYRGGFRRHGSGWTGLPGALMAVNPDGLRELHPLYASPKICGNVNFQKSTDFMMLRQLCSRPVPIAQGLRRFPELTHPCSPELTQAF
jgi:hypothetical protein